MIRIYRVQGVFLLGTVLLAPGLAIAQEPDWFAETTDSAVYGKRHEAASTRPLPSRPDVHTATSVTCVEDEGDVSVKFMIAAEDPARSPAFATGEANLWGGSAVVGKARTRLTDGLVPAASIVRQTNYANEVEIFSRPYIPGLRTTFLSTNSNAWNVLENLPIAIALQTNLGEVEFVIPRHPVVLNVLQKCAKGDRPTAFTSEEHLAKLEMDAAEKERLAEEQAAKVRSAIPDREAIQLEPIYNPRYPAKEARDGVGGVVILRVSVDAQGNVSDVQVETSSGNRNLDRSTMDAARRWRFSPAIRDGRPVSAVLLIGNTFTPPR